MQFWKSKKEKIHRRNIEVTTYEYDGQRIIVEGFLLDERFHESRIVTGEKFPPGVIHHMAIRLLINCSSFVIEDIDADLISVPRDFCREVLECLAPIKGMVLTKGFTAKAKKLVGGSKGCTHLLELLLAMAPAAVQGYGSYQEKKPEVFDPAYEKMALQFFINTCHAWREGGPIVEKLKKRLNMKQL